MKPGHFWRDERGAFAVLFAFGFVVLAMASVLAVDVGSLYFERRQVQAGVDLAAITAASNPARAEAIAQTVLVDAGLLAPDSTEGLEVIAGNYNIARPLDQRFQPNVQPLNAVSVRLEREGTLHFAQLIGTRPITSARGIAHADAQVSFSLGSRLASLNAGVVNALLSTLLGSQVSLSLLDYRALADVQVDLFSFLDALGIELGLTALNYNQLLEAEARTGVIAKALAAITNGPVRTIISSLGLTSQGNAIPLDKLVNLGKLGGLQVGSSSQVADLNVSVLELLTAAAALADGTNQVSLGVGANVPGLANLSVDLVIGEPPQGGGWFAIGSAGTVIRTAQIRLRINASLLGGPVLLGAGVHLPLWLDVAHSEAQVASAVCPSPSAPNGSAIINVRPGVLRLGVGELNNQQLHAFGTYPPQTEATLVNVLLLKIRASALVDVGATKTIPLNFSSADIGAATLKTARTSTIVGSLVDSLFSKLTIHVDVLGLGLSSPTVITQALRALLSPLAALLDLVINTLLTILGLGIGEADVRVYGVSCTTPVLVG